MAKPKMKKGVTLFFRGERVVTTGTVDKIHGGWFANCRYLTGNYGMPLVISIAFIKAYFLRGDV